MIDRESGHYHVIHTGPTIAYWSKEFQNWSMCGIETPFEDSDFDSIGAKVSESALHSWISVNDRLPSNKEIVLAYGSDGTNEATTYKCRYYAGDAHNSAGFIKMPYGALRATHWMKLPIPNSETKVDDTAHIKGLLEKNLPMLEMVKNILYDDNRDNAAIHISNLITEIQNALK